MARVEWFAAGGGVVRSGPYKSQVAAWKAMEYTAEIQERTRLTHPANTRVWPEDLRVLKNGGR